MLTKKQVESLEKGVYTNLQLHEKFPNHGKERRITEIPVDKLGNVVNPLSKDFFQMKKVLLGRKHI